MGIFAAFLSTIFSASKDIISKLLAVRIDGTTSTFASFAFALPYYLIVLTVLALLGEDILSFPTAFWWLVLARAVTDSFAEGMKMYALAHGDVSLVSIVFSLSPLVVLAATPLLDKGQVSVGGAVAVVTVVVGSVVLVWRPSHPDWSRQKKAMLLAVGAAIFFAANSIFDRLAMKQANQEDVGAAVMAGFTMTLTSALFLAPFVLTHRARLAGLAASQRGLHARGMLETAFMVCKLIAMQWMVAAYVVGLQRASLIIAIIAGRYLLKEGDFARRLVAGLLIMVGVAWIVWEQTSGF
jgi:drug/metabolite transporter (DMT)-like permease